MSDCSDGARADCSRASGGAPACGQPGCRDRPEAEPRPCGSPRPPRAMPPGRLRSPAWSEIAWRLLGVLAGGHGVERGAGHAPGGCRRAAAVGQTRAGRGGGTRRDLRRLGLQQFHLHGACMALSSSACTGRPCVASEASIPLAFSATARVTGATEVAPARHAKAAERPHACSWPSPSDAGKAWPGENVDEPSSPAFTTGHQRNFLLKIIGHVPVLLGHFD